jgi:hypothetical protein
MSSVFNWWEVRNKKRFSPSTVATPVTPAAREAEIGRITVQSKKVVSSHLNKQARRVIPAMQEVQVGGLWPKDCLGKKLESLSKK